MKPPAVVIGIGEMGGVFARGLLRTGHPVVPVLSDSDTDALAAQVPTPAVVLVAVGETQLAPVLNSIPLQWRQRLALLQNELLPRDWEGHGIDTPTVIAVWFEKKTGQDVSVIQSSPVHGPAAELTRDALGTLGIPAHVLHDAHDLCFELVRKNLYILTSNIAGLEAGGDVGTLWDNYQELAAEVAAEVLAIQEWRVGWPLPRQALLAGMVEAFHADPRHRCTGRSAPLRLARALAHADQAGLAVPRLRSLHAQFPAD
ncbi:MAG: hypothetical protein B7Z66_04680 [Chromatiales bacterium 21-64-14]|nr:MAG: hypothetical protein B7Z66_04680 [Chromatiales bacterium 21-64-14]HQU14625.1 hypothetical protein [Gammaproteobacteria bacterium]